MSGTIGKDRYGNWGVSYTYGPSAGFGVVYNPNPMTEGPTCAAGGAIGAGFEGNVSYDTREGGGLGAGAAGVFGIGAYGGCGATVILD